MSECGAGRVVLWRGAVGRGAVGGAWRRGALSALKDSRLRRRLVSDRLRKFILKPLGLNRSEVFYQCARSCAARCGTMKPGLAGDSSEAAPSHGALAPALPHGAPHMRAHDNR